MTDQKQVCTTSGSAIASTSRPPHGRYHQPLAKLTCCPGSSRSDELALPFSPASISIRLFPYWKAIFDATRDTPAAGWFAHKENR